MNTYINHPLDFFEIFYLLFVLAALLIRLPYARQHNKAKREHKIKTNLYPVKENVIAFLVGIGLFVLPLFDIFSNYLDKYSFELPLMARIIAVAGLLISLAIYTKSHIDLGRQWSPILETKTDHKLITSGIYKKMRHPMYLAFGLWAILVGFLIPNYLTILVSVMSFLILYYVRIPEEEELMVKQFGKEYVEYRKRTGTIWLKMIIF